MNTAAAQETKPVVAWFAAFAIAAIAMPLGVLLIGVKGPLAGLLIASPTLLIIKAALNALYNARHSTNPDSAVRGRYIGRILAITLVYIVSLVAALMLTDRADPITPLTIILALLPGIAVAMYFWAMARLIVEMTDEFQKTLLVRQSLIATGVTMASASIYGFLENFGVAPHVDAFWWPIVWFGGLAIGALANKIQYGTAGESA